VVIRRFDDITHSLSLSLIFSVPSTSTVHCTAVLCTFKNKQEEEVKS
jgi:hypothetical protein